MQNTKLSNVLIVGGGIAGMTSAISLSRLGVAVDIVDLDKDWRVYGAGISITGPTLRAFRMLDLLDEFRERGYCSDTTRLYTPVGDLIAEIKNPPLAADLPAGGGIMRPVLHDMLARRTRSIARSIRLGVTVDHYEEDADGASVRFTDGSSGRYDMVIGADGFNSRMRALLFPNAPKPRFTGQACWRTVAPRPPEVKGVEMFLGGRWKVGVNPCSPTEMYLFALVSAPGNPWVDPAEYPQRLRDALEGFGGSIAYVRDGITDKSSINYRPLEVLLMPTPWHSRRALLIGDAAHATTPHLASGAGLAVEDSVVLGELIATGADIDTVFAQFMARRYERGAMVVNNSVRIGELEQAGSGADEQQKLMTDSMAALAQPI